MTTNLLIYLLINTIINWFIISYNPNNLQILEKYVCDQSRDNNYDLEANLAVLKLYQFNPQLTEKSVVVKILLKALTSLPNTDFVLCKCLIESSLVCIQFIHLFIHWFNCINDYLMCPSVRRRAAERNP